MQSLVLLWSLMLAFVSWSMHSVFRVQRKQPSLRVLLIRMDTNKAFQIFFHYAFFQLSWINYGWTCWNLCVKLHANTNQSGRGCRWKIMSPIVLHRENVTTMVQTAAMIIHTIWPVLAHPPLIMMNHHNLTIWIIHTIHPYTMMKMSASAVANCTLLKLVKMLHLHPNLLCVHCRKMTTKMVWSTLKIHSL